MDITNNNMSKFKNTAIDFPTNVPVVLTLDIEPSKVQAKQKEGQWGPYNSYTYFATGNRVFLVNDALHVDMQQFHRGDVVTITKTLPVGQQKHVWIAKLGGVDNGSQGNQPEVTNDYILNQREILKGINEIKQYIINEKRPKIEVGEVPGASGPKPTKDDLGF